MKNNNCAFNVGNKCIMLDGPCMVTDCIYYTKPKEKTNFEKVAEILGVEIGEKFRLSYVDSRIDSGHGVCYLSEYGLIVSTGFVEDYTLRRLLMGAIVIEKIPWKPMLNQSYWFVNSFGEIRNDVFANISVSYYRFNVGNVFKTEQEITLEITERILKDMKGDYKND